LKFDKDWEVGASGRDSSSQGGADDTVVLERLSRGSGRPGFMVSGSSDCSVCVWDLYAEYPGCDGEEASAKGSAVKNEGQVRASVRKVLKGHSGGVLDLRIDERWIVSWCVKVFTPFTSLLTLARYVTFLS